MAASAEALPAPPVRAPGGSVGAGGGSMARTRRSALIWAYVFLVLFAVFFLTPPFYMLVTSLKSSGEIAAATHPWWVLQPTLENFWGLLGNHEFLIFFRN